MRTAVQHETSARRWSMSQAYAAIVGFLLLAVGLLGFFADASFSAGDDLQSGLLAGFEVNGWHNLVHVASGLAALAVCRSMVASRAFALAFGAVYAVVAVWGIVDGGAVLWVLPVNGADNVLHVAIAVLGIVAGLVDSRPAMRDGRGGGRGPA